MLVECCGVYWVNLAWCLANWMCVCVLGVRAIVMQCSALTPIFAMAMLFVACM